MRQFHLVLFFACAIVSCKDFGKTNWVQRNTCEIKSIDPTDTDYTNLESIKSAIGNSRVVLLGEQEHGDGSTYLAKSRLVKFLHAEMGFNILAFEGDFFSINKAWDDYKAGQKEFQDVIN